MGLTGGTVLAYTDGLKPVHAWHLRGGSYGVYTGLLALAVNVLVVLAFNATLPKGNPSA